ncbi:class I SAM-dependent DNA methyltransferase [Deinococcus soli (ex Cha et al. 2016)]|uniref:site-specific DNA-methyltransferase (adenine-specific) n=2 Tax=Deinococcus soli (ex Cha et al. 2016) TaxID=1309411 RepID=A0AAE4BM84_9DEIO|nr:class I SAM-dependent DNA methyltransferase [Deinococcus soli (ex Cha et al. 2016)]MDR6219843.1 type I restriction enzyme M protein [Deinococcus soli (ex Cha et al. 2016)]MDR6329899.1 type I restriction enzyme M protein [Deinococcus soli (ex Cha et al. 2016)]MDR6752750.1 type I restriction enzyme M protein [Deinococcus soli (ex Cha et al. 2016)]
MTTNTTEVERRLWAAADNLRANSKLRSHEYSTPVLGLIFLAYADHRFQQAQQELGADADPIDFQAEGVMYLPEQARYRRLLALPEGENLGAAINEAMNAIEAENEDLKGVLPKIYNRLDNSVLAPLLKAFNFEEIAAGLEGDAFGKVYEYFLGEFAKREGQLGGEFYTPTSLVKLMVEIMEPFHGRIYDPACGSGGMFVQSARFVTEHQKNPTDELSVFGQEKTAETVRLARMNLAVHGLSGDIKQGNTFYEDIHSSRGKFDFALANPPFNVKGIKKDDIASDPRLPYGLPSTDNGNYLWLQYISSSLNDKGRAGVVMANSASDARGSEQLIRQRMIQSGNVDIMLATSSNLFYTVTLPATVWFLDNGKRGSAREDKVLFIDARNTFVQVTRAIREMTDEQVEFLANIANLYRGEQPEFRHGNRERFEETFPGSLYRDVPGLCKVATRSEIEAQGWSLNPGRYVGVTARAADDFDFTVRLGELNEELETLTAEAHELEQRISENVQELLGEVRGGVVDEAVLA